MKKIFILVAGILAMIMFPLSALAINVWVTVNPATVVWDPVTTLVGGSPIPSGSVIKYDVFIKGDGTQTPITKVTATPVTATSFSVTFTVEGKFNFGVQALRFDASGNLLSSSMISWSDNSAAVQGGSTFGENFYLAPSGVVNLRPQ